MHKKHNPAEYKNGTFLWKGQAVYINEHGIREGTSHMPAFPTLTPIADASEATWYVEKKKVNRQMRFFAVNRVTLLSFSQDEVERAILDNALFPNFRTPYFFKASKMMAAGQLGDVIL